MAALNFPPSPALNDIFSSGDRSWKFNGVAWQLMPRTTDNIQEGTNNLYFTNARVAAAPAVTQLQSDLAGEVSTRTSEIARIDTRVDNVLSNIDPVALDSLTEVVTAFQNADGSLSDAITALSTAATSALGVERDARIAADSDLQDAIDAESTRAQGVESQINSDLATEVTARQTAISTEQSARAAAISAEQTARQTAISTEQSARATAIASETSAREAAILAEQTARETAISSVNTRVDNVLSNIDPAALDSLTEVVSAFQSADGSITEAITNLTASSATAIAAEETRALAAEAALSSAITAEGTRALAAEGVLSTAIAAEETRALAAEGVLASDIDSLETALAAEVSARQTAISTEQSARAAAVSAEETRALAAESVLTSALAAEVSARETAISTEQSARAAAVSAEETRALAAEAALSSDLSAVNTRVDNVLSNIDPAALDSLTEVVSAFQSADSSINGAITSLAESAAANLVIERDARIAADSVIDTTVSTLTDSIPDRVRAVLLSGLSLATNAAVAASDSVLTAFGKLQAQVTAAFSAIDSEVSTRASEISRVDARSAEIAIDLATEVTDRQTAVFALQTALDNEVSRAQSIESAIDNQVQAETENRQIDVQSVRDALATEVTDRTNDVQSVRDITDGLGTMSTQNSDAVNITGGTITGVTVNAQSMEVGTGATADLFVGNDGKVGIGTEAPTEKLTVNGNIDILGGQVKNLGTPVDDTDAATKDYVDRKNFLYDEVEGTNSLVIYDGSVSFYSGLSGYNEGFRKTQQTNFSNALDLQKKLVVSDTAPEHVDGREWLDTTDFRRYISISSAWVESITA